MKPINQGGGAMPQVPLISLSDPVAGAVFTDNETVYVSGLSVFTSTPEHSHCSKRQLPVKVPSFLLVFAPFSHPTVSAGSV